MVWYLLNMKGMRPASQRFTPADLLLVELSELKILTLRVL